LTRSKASNGSTIAWLKIQAKSQTDECIPWPFGGKPGRGKIAFRGTLTYPSRALCILAHGNPPTSKHVAAHSCRGGNDGCCNPRHVRWATQKENCADKITHGTYVTGEKTNSAKLTNEQADEIRKLRETLRVAEIAEKFSVAESTIYLLLKYKSYA
jgi:hypothetical protein